MIYFPIVEKNYNYLKYNLDIPSSTSINNGKWKKKNHSSKTIPTGAKYLKRITIIVITISRNQPKLQYKKKFMVE